MDKIFFVQDALHITENELLQRIADAAELRTIKKGEEIIRVGDSIDYVYFNIQGIFRGFFSDIDGKEITDCFVYKYGVSLAPTFDINGESPITVQALTDAQTLRIPIKEINHWVKEYYQISELYIQLLIQSVNEHWELKVALCIYSAMDRYLWFLDKYPGLIDVVNNRYIASYLNITPVTLSRLRGVIKNQKKMQKGKIIL